VLANPSTHQRFGRRTVRRVIDATTKKRFGRSTHHPTRDQPPAVQAQLLARHELSLAHNKISPAAVIGAKLLLPTPRPAGPTRIDSWHPQRCPRSLQQAHPKRSRSLLRQGKDVRPWSQGSEAAWKGSRGLPGRTDAAGDCARRAGFQEHVCAV
jgi:hypothetical protein